MAFRWRVDGGQTLYAGWESRFWCESSSISTLSVCNQSKLSQDWVGLNESILVKTLVHFHTFFLYRSIGFVQSVEALARLGEFRFWCEPPFLHKTLFTKLFKAVIKWTKIHVQIMRFTCCLNMSLNLTSPGLFAWSYRENVVNQTDNFADAYVRWNVALLWRCDEIMTLWRNYDVWQFTADTILFRELQCKKKNSYNVWAAFSVRICLEQGKTCKNNDVCYSRNRSALAVNCWVIIHCLKVSCQEDQIKSAQGEWFIFV